MPFESSSEELLKTRQNINFYVPTYSTMTDIYDTINYHIPARLTEEWH